MTTAILPVAAAFLSVVVLTPLVRLFARRIGMVAQPRKDRWHVAPTPKLGGLAILLAVAIGVVTGGYARLSPPLLIASVVMFVVGLIDDYLALGPHHKLVLQLVPSLIVVHYGLVLPWTRFEPANIALTLLWLTGITNAINLLDNMDGVAAGIAAIASVSLAVNFVRNGQLDEAVLTGILFAALAGFLLYNFNPASIFMGDCGSNFIGFFLAGTALLSANVGGRSRTFLPVIVVPVLVLLIPIFDTTFVAFARKLAGRSSVKGGRDHTSHRLVALGLRERTAVLLLYALALVTGAVAIAARDLPFDVSLALIGAVTIVVAILGFYLAGVKVYPADEVAAGEKRAVPGFLLDLSYRRRVFEVLLDIILIGYSYYLAYRLHFGAPDGGPDWTRFLQTLPVILATKTIVFLLLGMYGRMWRYIGVEDALLFIRAIGGASIAAVLVLLGVSRFEGLSRVVFVLDALILFVLVTAARLSFRFFDHMLHRAGGTETQGIRTLIFGAGDAGEMLLRELRNNRALGHTPAAFFDDDPKKRGRHLRGIPVLGGDFEKACRQCRAEEVIVSARLVAPERLAELARVCRALALPLRQLRIDLVPAELPELLRAADADQ